MYSTHLSSGDSFKKGREGMESQTEGWEKSAKMARSPIVPKPRIFVLIISLFPGCRSNQIAVGEITFPTFTRTCLVSAIDDLSVDLSIVPCRSDLGPPPWRSWRMVVRGGGIICSVKARAAQRL